MRKDGKDLADAAMLIFDEAVNDYIVNALRIAVSCADDLGQPEITEWLTEALRITKFHRNDHETLRRLLVAAKILPVAA